MLLALACSEPPRSPVTWTDGPVEGLATAWRFTASGRGEVTCTADDDPEEIHAAGGSGELVLTGLLADTAYTCVLAAGRTEETRAVVTDPLPDWLPAWDLPVRGDTTDYTLLNHGTDVKDDRQDKLLVVDADGRLRWYHDSPYEASDLDAQYVGDGRVLYGGGYRAPPTLLDGAGRTVRVAVPEGVWHHHVEELESGEVLALRRQDDALGEDQWHGFSIDLLDPTMTTVTWTWASQRGIEDGWLPTEGTDPYHANAVAFVGGDVLVNLYRMGVIAKIDRATGDLVWTLGPGGDFALLEGEWFERSHAPEYDGDRVLLYDNGIEREASRVVELALDEEARTARVVWEWTEPGWYERIWGDVDRLASGNVLVTRAHCDHCTSNTDQRTEVVEVDPATNAVVWRLRFRDPHDASYRAQRIDGCAIFANAKYCAR